MTGADRLTRAQLEERRAAAEAEERAAQEAQRARDQRRALVEAARKGLADLDDKTFHEAVMGEAETRLTVNPTPDQARRIMTLGEDLARIGWAALPPEEA